MAGREDMNRWWKVPVAKEFGTLTLIWEVTRANQCLGKNELAM